MARRHVTFPCGDLFLEGELVIPDGKTRCPAVAVCHPHPLYGGDMHNEVITTVCKTLEDSGIVSLRFNFRGTGRSTGSHDQGRCEQDDLKAAISFLEDKAEVAADRLGASGYSFGAGVTVRTAPLDDRIKAIAAISLPTRIADFTAIEGYDRAKLFISGGEDQYGPVEGLERLVASLPEPKRCLIVKGADHFWFHGLEEAAREVANFFAAVL